MSDAALPKQRLQAAAALLPAFVLVALLGSAAGPSASPAAAAYPVEEGWVDASGDLRHYRIVGRGPPLVILRGGFRGSAEDLLSSLLPLVRIHRLVFLDKLGRAHPESAQSEPIEVMVTVLETVRKELKLGRITLLADPYGAPLARAYAERYPAHVAQVVLASGADPSEALQAIVPPRKGSVPLGELAPGAGRERPLRARDEPHHVTKFENQYVRVEDLVLPPGDATLFHEHTLDRAFLIVKGSDIVSQDLGGEPDRIQMETGRVGYMGYSAKPRTHRLSNVGSGVLELVGVEIVAPREERFTASERPPIYELVLDEDRLRAWRLILEPGQASPFIRRSAPGIRIAVTAGKVAERVKDRPEQEATLAPGSLQWQPAGVARSLRNAGTSRIELVEFELK